MRPIDEEVLLKYLGAQFRKERSPGRSWPRYLDVV